MIAPLRRRHRWMTGVLFLAVPAVLLLALRSRVTPVKMEALPADLALDLPPVKIDEPEMRSSAALGDLDIAVRVAHSDGVAILELTAPSPLAEPDVLLYWAASDATDQLPESPVLLGAYSDRRRVYMVPEEAAVQEGYLVLYSLAHQKVLASGALPRLSVPLPPIDSAEGDQPS